MKSKKNVCCDKIDFKLPNTINSFINNVKQQTRAIQLPNINNPGEIIYDIQQNTNIFNLKKQFSENPFTDMGIENLQINDVLLWNGFVWKNNNINFNDIKLEDLINVKITNLQPNQVLTYNGTGLWVNMTIGTGGVDMLSSLIDVNIPITPNNNPYYLGWDFQLNKWVNRIITTSDIINLNVITTLAELTDTIILNPVQNQILQYNGTKWINQSLGNLTDLNDVTISNPVNNHLLYYNGTQWVNTNVNQIIKLQDLMDTSIQNPSSGQILQYNGTVWINKNLPNLSNILTWTIIDIKNNGIHGGNAIPNIWTLRNLNQMLFDSGDNIILLQNQLIIKPGNYLIDINTVFYQVGLVRIRFYNITNNLTSLLSGTLLANSCVNIQLNGIVEVLQTTTFEIQYYTTDNSQNTDLGIASGIDEEIYLQVNICKLPESQLLWVFTDMRNVGLYGSAAITHAWTPRNINYTNVSHGNQIILSNNTLEIQPGNYQINIIAFFYKTSHTRIRLFNQTTNTVIATSNNYYIIESQNVCLNLNLNILDANIFKLEYFITSSELNVSLGIPSGFEQEKYLQIQIIKYV